MTVHLLNDEQQPGVSYESLRGGFAARGLEPEWNGLVVVSHCYSQGGIAFGRAK